MPTPESRLLDERPGVRELVQTLPDFIAWRDALHVVVVDETPFWVVGGDQLMDHDQVIVEWVRLWRPELIERGTDNGEGP